MISHWPGRLGAFFDYYRRADPIYSIHSPFLFDFIQSVLDRDRIHYDFDRLYSISEQLKSNDRIIPDSEFARQHQQAGKSISKMFRQAGQSFSGYESLYRLALYLKSGTILELGSCAGMSGCSLALGHPKSRVTCVEGNTFLSGHCQSLFQYHGIQNAECIGSDFHSFLNRMPPQNYELAFLDGHHDAAATRDYLRKILEITTADAVIVLDDIHWSGGMHQAWKDIIQWPQIHSSLETARWGFLFKNKNITPGAFRYIERRYKPWRIGLFK
ncbi:MAG TPA: class I SAM-dependent methyltransferase [Saprospiraceae bacterium]|nr:class I SAM-dependent methyltransferase [Saprospiraceae bacterium]